MPSTSIGFKNCKKASDRCCSRLSVSRRLGDIAACGVHGDTAPGLQKRIYNMAFEGPLICGGAADMFRARPEADETCGQLSQNWKPFQQTKHEWK